MAPKSVTHSVVVTSASAKCRNMSYESSSSRLGCIFNYTQIKPTNDNNNSTSTFKGGWHGKNVLGGVTRSGTGSSGFTPRRKAEEFSLRSWVDNNPGLVHSLLFLLAISVFWNSLDGDLVFDDITAIRDNKDLRPHTPLSNLWRNDFWGTPMEKEQSHKSYRPLTVFTFRLNYLFSGLSPQPFHLVNVILHGLVCLLYLRFCRRLVASSVVALVASVLFTLHPVHTEAVSGVVGRAELLSSLWYLSALLSFTRAAASRGPRRRTCWRPLMWTLVFTTMAMLSKEQGITAVAVCVTYELFVTQQLLPSLLGGVIHGGGGNPLKSAKQTSWFLPCAQRVGILSAFTLVALAMRMRLMVQLPAFYSFDNPAAAAPSPTRQLSHSYLIYVNARLLLEPSSLCCDWTMRTVSLVTSVFDPRNLNTVAAVATFALLCLSAVHRCQRSLAIILSMIIFPFLPASNLFFPVGFVVAERVLYLPSMGFCLLVAKGWDRVGKLLSDRKASAWLSRAWNAALLFLMSIHAAKTVTRNLAWRDEFSLFASGLQVTQSNAKLWNNAGHAMEVKGRFQDALSHFRKAAQIQPDDVGAYINVGRTLTKLERVEEAEISFNKAKSLLPRTRSEEVYHARVAPHHLNVFLHLATLIARNESRLEEADSLCRRAISMRPDHVQAYISQGEILMRLNRTAEARTAYETALTLEEDNADILYNLGVVLLKQGSAQKALSLFELALLKDPDHEQALMNSAILIQETGSSAGRLRKVAIERLEKIARRAEDGGREPIARPSRSIRRSDADPQEEVDPTSNERVHFNLAMLHMDNGDLKSSEEHFRKAIAIRPDFRSALFNFALLLSETNRALESAPFLHQLVEHHPDHVKGLILLGDLYVNQHGNLQAAERCYNRILEIEPDNVQGQHNLCVVRLESNPEDVANVAEVAHCLRKVHSLAPHEEYIQRHLDIVVQKLDSLKIKVPRRGEGNELK